MTIPAGRPHHAGSTFRRSGKAGGHAGRLAARVTLGAVMVLAIGSFLALHQSGTFSIAWLRGQLQPLDAIVSRHPVISALLYFAAYALAGGLSIPGGTILTLGAGALFGVWEGTLIASFGSAIGASMAFLIARFLLRDFARRRMPKLFRRVDQGIAEDGVFYLISARLVPLVPYELINMTAGLTALDLRRFYWASQLGMLPINAVVVNAGASLGRGRLTGTLFTPRLIVAFLLIAALPLATTLIRDALGFVRRRRR